MTDPDLRTRLDTARERADPVQEIAERWASLDAFLFAKRYPDSWIDHARKDIPNLISWLGTEREMHAAWRKRAEEAEAALAAVTPPEPVLAEGVAGITRYSYDGDAHERDGNGEWCKYDDVLAELSRRCAPPAGPGAAKRDEMIREAVAADEFKVGDTVVVVNTQTGRITNIDKANGVASIAFGGGWWASRPLDELARPRPESGR